MMIRKLVILTAAAALVACQGPAGKDGSNGAMGETGDQGETGIAGDSGNDGSDLAAPEAAIAAVAPNVLLAGRSTTIRVVGYFTEWDETTTVNFSDSDGNALDSVQAETVSVSPVGLVVTVTVAADTALGAVAMNIVDGDNTLTYAPEGAQVVVAATAVSSQRELRAGEDFDIMLEVAEYMRNPSLNSENCVAMANVQMARYSQYKFNVIGHIQAASALGDCSLSLVQDAETDDEWVSGAIVSVVAPDVITFNEGTLSGELTAERSERIIAISAAAGDVVSVRHTVDADNGLDGTGSTISVFLEGNLEPMAVHHGGDSWLEVANVEARELLFVISESLDEGDDPVSFNLTTIVPNTTMTALQDGATQAQRLPANGDGVVEAGRASWYTITNEASVWATIGLAASNEDALQSGMVLFVNDTPIAIGTTEWAGVLPAGVTVLKVLDRDYDAEDGVLEFALELGRTVLLDLDENGAANGTLTNGNNAMILVDAAAGQVTHVRASREGDDAQPNVSAIWRGASEAVATGVGGVDVPSIEGGALVLSISLEGDLGEGVAFTINVTNSEPMALDLAGTDGSAPENGGQWFVGGSYGNLNLALTPGTADHLQTGLSVYSATGAELAAVQANEVSVDALMGGFFVKVSDGEFVADQDQTFSLAGSITDPAIDGCRDISTPLSTDANEDMAWSVQGDFTDAPPMGYRDHKIVRHMLTISEPAILDTYLDTAFDSRLVVLHGCITTSWYGGPTLVAHNDDGRDWNGNSLGTDGGINNVTLPQGQYIIGVSTYSNWNTDGGDFTLHYRLRSPE
jgi:hypothetical protein